MINILRTLLDKDYEEDVTIHDHGHVSINSLFQDALLVK